MSERNQVALVSGAVLTALVLAGCGGGAAEDSQTPAAGSAAPGAPAELTVTEPLVVTYDGGVAVLDGETLELKNEIPMDGFLRVNPAGDDSHVLISTGDGFQALNATTGRLTDVTFPAAEPGHVVVHGETTALFADGTGEVTIFDAHELSDGVPQTEKFNTPTAHHGVAVVLDDGTRVVSEGTEDGRTGAVALAAGGTEIAASDQCPGLHGETVVADEAVVFGCENGPLVYRAGVFTKIPSPDAYGRTGNLKGSADSPIALGDYKTDPDAELERPNQFALIDTTSNQLRLVSLPAGVSYSFRSLARGPHAEALMLGTDGRLYVVDPATAEFVRSIDVVGPWTEPDEWQQPRPTVFTRGHDVYVTDPASNEIKLVDVETGEVTETATLPNTPNEISGPAGHEH
ncbi:MAG: zinc metallochaperone AztD [Mycobacterium sp.]